MKYLEDSKGQIRSNLFKNRNILMYNLSDKIDVAICEVNISNQLLSIQIDKINIRSSYIKLLSNNKVLLE